MFKSYVTLAFSTLTLLNSTVALGQHCAPIVESYLQSVAIKRSVGEIAFDIDYKKTGGQRKEGYQAYILAYSQSNAERVATMTPQEAIETKVASVVHTQLAERQENGCYRIQWALETRGFVEAMLKDSRLDSQQVNDFGNWKSFKGEIRFAVFIPFLEDEKYSVVKGLPEKKHECNYLQESSLLFDTLSQRVSVHFGIVQAIRLPGDEYYIQINGHRPLAKVKEDAK
jgi:hypothetical protein